MADRITVDTDCYNLVAQRLQSLQQELEAAGDQLQGMYIGRNAGARVKMSSTTVLRTTGGRYSGDDVETSLHQLARAAQCLAAYALQVARSSQSASDLFADVEHRIASSADAVQSTAFEGAQGSGASSVHLGLDSYPIRLLIGELMGFSGDPQYWTTEMKEKVDEFIAEATFLQEDGVGLITTDDKIVFLLGDEPLAVLDHDHSMTRTSNKLVIPIGMGELALEESTKATGYKRKKDLLNLVPDDAKATTYYKDGQSYTQDPNSRQAKEDFKIFSVKASGSAEYSAISEHVHAINGKLETEGNIKIGTIAAEGNVEAGLWRYSVSEDGTTQKVLAPGAKAHVGISASALELDGSMTYEFTDNISGEISSEVAILKGYAEADAKIGFVDGNISASVSGKAGVDLISATVEGSLDVAGIKGTVGATAKVGVGIEGAIGYDNGVIKISGGASLGVGLSVNCELDIGGFVNNVADTVGKHAQQIQNAASNVGNAIGGFSEAVGDLLTDVWNPWA